MKLIDEKGKLFGKINIIDLFVLLVILLVVAFGVYKYGGKEVSRITGQEITVRDVTFTFLTTVDNEDIAKRIHADDKFYFGNDEANVTIDSIRYTPAKVYTTNKDGLPVYSEDPIKKDVYITMKMQYDQDTPSVQLKNTNICINTNFTFRTKTVFLPGTIVDVQIKEIKQNPK